MTRVAFLLLSAALPAGAAADAVPVERTRYLMGTTCRAVAVAPAAEAAPALERALDRIAVLEAVLSPWRPESELSRVNATAHGAAVTVSPDMALFLDRALHFSRLTDGAFDPTVGALVEAWRLRDAGRVPDATELEQALRATGHRHVALDAASPTVRHGTPDVRLDPGGIGKGMALDAAADVIGGAGIDAFLLDFGGQLLARGAAPGETTWPVAIADPRDRARPLLVLGLSDASLSTSAQSEHGVRVGGRWYGHVLDPRTGQPLPTAGSCTVLARTATEADALSTALLVMGPNDGLAWALAHDVEALWLTPAGRRVRLVSTPGLRGLIPALPAGVVSIDPAPRRRFR
jgi:thiamine biosynthesis lipoprotein